LILSHMIVALCYNEMMLLFTSNIIADHYQKMDGGDNIMSHRLATGMRRMKPDTNESFSACLLVMDENFRLQEWIANAYFTLPLRYLVVTVDPRSKVMPTEKLDIFRNELNITILEWQDSDFMNYRPLSKNASTAKIRTRHRARQNRFYETCMKHLYDFGKTWTALYDTDEFLVFSTYNHRYEGGTITSPKSMAEPGSILEFIQQSRRSGSWDPLLNNMCFMIPRMLYGGKEITKEELAMALPEGAVVKPSQLDTVRWRYHNPGAKAKHNGPAKVIIDVSGLAPFFPLKVDSPHRPIRDVCGPSALYKDIKESPFRINHYLGSWEAYSFRDDSRKGAERSREIWEFRANSSNAERSDEAASWLKGFYKQVGVDRANIVLDGAGLPETYIPPEDDGWTFKHDTMAFKGKESIPKDFLEFVKVKKKNATQSETEVWQSLLKKKKAKMLELAKKEASRHAKD